MVERDKLTSEHDKVHLEGDKPTTEHDKISPSKNYTCHEKGLSN